MLTVLYYSESYSIILYCKQFNENYLGLFNTKDDGHDTCYTKLLHNLGENWLCNTHKRWPQ